MKKILICFGTRPEAIKLAPIVWELTTRKSFNVQVCVTSQHRKMLDQVLELFEIKPNFDLDLMTPGQSLEKLTGDVIYAMTGIIDQVKPDCIIVQGDTTTTFATALSAFYKQILVAHVEAGLRTYHKYAPFPEEINRQMTACLADWHFTPTDNAREALLKENFPGDRVITVGNTVIDSLINILDKSRAHDRQIRQQLSQIDHDKKMILVTGHRRENFGQGFINICQAIRHLATNNPNLEIVYPVHLNPQVQSPVKSILSNLSNIHLIPPQDYLTFIWLLDHCEIVLTDSGGVQEEAPSLGKPVLIMRETTERQEAVDAGTSRIVGTDYSAIIKATQQLLDDKSSYAQMSHAQNPYGDGTSSQQIADILEKALDTITVRNRV